MSTPRDAPHLPRLVPVDGYGKGGFQFGGMSHRGSILCLPSGIWAWPVNSIAEISESSLSRVWDEASQIDLFLLGSGTIPWSMPEALRWRFRDSRTTVEVMPTGPAIRTFNVLVAENRRVAAGLIAVD
ncbi:MAG TPA: Mth938-like domain-containing protein [Xanthobacteraceae bacterium]|jgi:uncharacterized protein|nr:Mth938-like domain-containing protein [Xanthobacteraceae bacterium]